jgi:hypothetical protein
VSDPLIAAARFLGSQLEWLRHATDAQGQPYAVAAFAEIAQCAGRLRGLVNGPAEQKYLGPCGAPQIDVVPISDGEGSWDMTEVASGEPCDGDIYGPRGGSRGRCRTCGAEVAQADRQAWLDGEVNASDLAWTAAGIAHALHLNAKTIRSWATERRAPNGVMLRRAKLATYWHNGTQLVPWVDPLPGEDVKARGDRLHYVADVARLAAEAADRRAAERARKEQHGEAA